MSRSSGMPSWRASRFWYHINFTLILMQQSTTFINKTLLHINLDLTQVPKQLCVPAHLFRKYLRIGYFLIISCFDLSSTVAFYYIETDFKETCTNSKEILINLQFQSNHAENQAGKIPTHGQFTQYKFHKDVSLIHK